MCILTNRYASIITNTNLKLTKKLLNIIISLMLVEGDNNMKKLCKKDSFKPVFNLIDIITSLVAAYLFSATFNTLKSLSAVVSYVKFSNKQVLSFAVCFLLSAVVITLFDAFFKEKNISRYCFICNLLAFTTIALLKENNVLTYFVFFVIVAICLYCFENKVHPEFTHKVRKKKDRTVTIAVVSLTVFFTISIFSALRYYTYSAPNYDFGIFCNMFYNMKESGQAVTTCERDTLLSHFAVHISPIFYLLLPFYLLSPSPVTLAVMQPAVIFSAVIPFYLLAKKLKISDNAVLFFTLSFVLYAPLSTGCFYDLHENCFLVPLLMWVFYFFESEKTIPMFISVLLVLLVKEDAFIYIVFFALYIFINRKKYLKGSILIVLALSYFIFASFLLTKYGTGIMSSRYDNLSNGEGLLESVKTILLNPGYAIKQVLETKDETADKILYLIELFCPLAFIPFMTKDLTAYTLILPLFINLLTKYPHQYDISFQYTFGIAAFLFYLSLLNISKMKEKKQHNLTFMSLVASALLFIMIITPKYVSYLYKYTSDYETYNAITEALEIIPDDAEVTASAYIVPHLSSRKTIFEDEYHEEPTTEYFVLDRSRPAANGREKMYVDAGYELIFEIDGVLEIYQNKDMS